MLINPNWRPELKNKFKGKKGFITQLRKNFGGKFDNQAWETSPFNSLPSLYIGGYEETGNVQRKRDKAKEVINVLIFIN